MTAPPNVRRAQVKTRKKNTMSSLKTVKPDFTRDRYGRPLITPPGHEKPVAYTRCTKFVDCVEDKYNLELWQQRMVALGLAARPDLVMSVQAHRENKQQLNKITAEAREAAGASAAATTGTALHSLTELVDRGQPLPEGLSAEVLASLEAYRTATADLKAIHIEQALVLDKLQVAGTTDRIVQFGKGRYIADIKTGSIDFGALKIAMQLAIYAHSWAYDTVTHSREPHGADLTRGIVIHLPAGEAKATLHWVDLKAGWEAVRVARDVREKRKLKATDLYERFGLATEQLEVVTTVPSLEERIRASLTADAVRELWAAHATEWTDHLTEVAKAHIASLPTAV